VDIIRKDTDYAVRCLVRLAGLDVGVTENVKEIAAREALPEPMLRKIMQRLVRSEIVCSVRGRTGGVRLARHPHEITLLEILDAVQGEITLNRCVRPDGCCENRSACRLHPSLKKVQHRIADALQDTTLQDML
jgi:Rrf2 family iron-sulfur cluster assembly transcriptional regulator